MSTAAELKAAQNKLSHAQAKRKQLKEELAATERKLAACNAEISDLNKRIQQITKGGTQPVVTEHAILRFLERVKGLNIEELQKEILTPDVVQQIQTIGSGSFTRDGYRLVVKGGTVITVEPTK